MAGSLLLSALTALTPSLTSPSSIPASLSCSVSSPLYCAQHHSYRPRHRSAHPSLRRAPSLRCGVVSGAEGGDEGPEGSSSGEGDTSQARLKALLQQLSAAPPAPVKRKPSGYARDYAQLKPKAKVMGARLDTRLAGESVLGVNVEPEEPHEELFAAGVKAMKAGQYKTAVTAFTRAVASVPGGLTSREGGQYSVWLAQALQANGRSKEAVGLLQRCESHPDGDVRKISESVLYVMQAPELKLSKENFVQIDFDSTGPPEDWGKWRPPKRDPENEPPEMYSVEWYVQEFERKRAMGKPVEKEDLGTQLALALLISVGFLAALAVVT